MKYPHLAARVFNTPLLIHPQKLDAIIAGLGGRLLDSASLLVDISGESALQLPPELFSTRRVAENDVRSGYAVTDGVAVIMTDGALVHRGRMEGMSTRLLGYNDLAMATENALADPDVHAVLHVFNTPGGEAQGAFEYHDRLRAMSGVKPMRGISDGMAASAGYLAAAAMDEFAITKTGYAGSIGVVMRHVDLSAAMAADGVRITHIYAGSHKVDGNPYEALAPSVRDEYQAETDGLYQMFIEAVATGRRMDVDAVRRTQAQTYRGAAAVAARLADRISTVDQMISELAALRTRPSYVGQPARATAQTGDISMSDTTPAGQAQQAPANSYTQADIDRARTDATAVERARVNAILNHSHASANLPQTFACINAGMSYEQSAAVLDHAKAPPVATLTTFDTLMAAVGNPAVSGIEAADQTTDPEAALAAQILASIR